METPEGDCAVQCKHKNERVQVVVRCRPMNLKEIAEGHTNIVDVQTPRGVIEIYNPRDEDRYNRKMFTFDAAYDSTATQQDIYDESVRPLVNSVLNGFNGTIFAYGQTGTGKTYTMEGSPTLGFQYQGIIPRSFEQIFSHISRTSNMQFLVRASYLEIYQEEIRDLLDPNPKKRYELREHIDSGVYVKDLQSFVCKSIHEIDYLMSFGNHNRTIGATNMNEHSSRSHAIFIVTVEMSDTHSGLENQVRVGKLNLVDLAGSERQSKTGSSGTRLKEASKINLSLSALGNVISALVDGKGQHIPYRDSKLTRLLQDSLGGNSKTLMIANIGPASYNYEESLTTLRYANRAKNIQNQPRINEDPKDALLRQYQEEINRLKAMLQDQVVKRAIVPKKKKSKKKLEGGDESEEETKSHAQWLIEEEESLSLKEKRLLNQDNQLTENERQQLMLEIEKKKESIAYEKRIADELDHKISSMESKLLVGGKTIIDHTNEQQKALEQRSIEISHQKRREVQIRQQLEAAEETVDEVRDVFVSLQQEVEAKNAKLRKLYAKLQSIKQETTDITEVFNSDRRDLENTHNELLKDYKLRLLIIENFIPPEERRRLSSRLFYDDEEDIWRVMPDSEPTKLLGRLIASFGERRPITEYTKAARDIGLNYRYKGENILELMLDEPDRTTTEYQGPAVAPSVMSVLEAALKGEEDIDVDASIAVRSRYGQKIFSVSRNIKQTFPKTRGLVPK